MVTEKNKKNSANQSEGEYLESIEKCKTLEEVQKHLNFQTKALFKKHNQYSCPKCAEYCTFTNMGRGGNTTSSNLKLEQYQCKACGARSRLRNILTATELTEESAKYTDLLAACKFKAEHSNRQTKIDSFFSRKQAPVAEENNQDETTNEAEPNEPAETNGMAVDQELPIPETQENQETTEVGEVIETIEGSQPERENPITHNLLLKTIEALTKDKEEQALQIKKLQELIQALQKTIEKLGETRDNEAQSRGNVSDTSNQDKHGKSAEKTKEKNQEKNPKKQENIKKNQKKSDGWHVVPPRGRNITTKSPEVPVSTGGSETRSKSQKRQRSKSKTHREPQTKDVVEPNKGGETSGTKKSKLTKKNTYANTAKNASINVVETSTTNNPSKYKPAKEKSKQAKKLLIKSLCTKRTAPPIAISVVYMDIQNNKPFIQASKNRDYQTQRYLMNCMCKHYGISKYVQNKVMIGNSMIQLFINEAHESDVCSTINNMGGNVKLENEVKAGDIPTFLRKQTQKDRAKKNIINRAVRLYRTAPTLTAKQAVLRAYNGQTIEETKRIIVKIQEKINPAEEGFRWTFVRNELVEVEIIEEHEDSESDNESDHEAEEDNQDPPTDSKQDTSNDSNQDENNQLVEENNSQMEGIFEPAVDETHVTKRAKHIQENSTDTVPNLC